jgi:hypothetical protein
MGLLGKKPATSKEVKGFARGKRANAKAAEAHAQAARSRASAKRAGGTNLAAQSAKWKKEQKQQGKK